jgi:hypothetical protein
MLPVEVDGTEEFWQEFKWSSCGEICCEDHGILSSKFNDEDDPEDLVVEECLEDIVLVLVDNSAVDHIDDVHKHESVEAHNISSQLISWYEFEFIWDWYNLTIYFLSHLNLFIFLVLHNII